MLFLSRPMAPTTNGISKDRPAALWAWTRGGRKISLLENMAKLGLPAAKPDKQEVGAKKRKSPDALAMPPRQSRASSLLKSPVGLCGGDVQKHNN